MPRFLDRGKVRVDRPAPPAPLSVIELAPAARVSSAGMSIDDVVREMIVAYKVAGTGQHMATLARNARTCWWGTLREMASLLIDESLSPRLYVAFVCRELLVKRPDRFPFPAQVFALKSLRGWISGYRKSQSVPPTTYAPTEDRIAQHHAAVFARLRSD